MLRYLVIISISVLCVRTFTCCSHATPACFTWSPETITTQSTVKFNASCIERASIFRWNFGDSSAVIITTSLTTEHRYSVPGVYTVTVTGKPIVTRVTGNTETTQTRVIIVK